MSYILGVWAVAAGISITFTYFKQYRARPRYVYLPLLGGWAITWGLQQMRHEEFVPRWTLWVLFLAGIAAMMVDSVRRYRETWERLRKERMERLGLRPEDLEKRAARRRLK